MEGTVTEVLARYHGALRDLQQWEINITARVEGQGEEVELLEPSGIWSWGGAAQQEL